MLKNCYSQKRAWIYLIISLLSSCIFTACRPLSGVYRSDYNLAIFADSTYLTSCYIWHQGTMRFGFGEWEVEEDTLILRDYYMNHPIPLYVGEVEDSLINDTVIYRNDRNDRNFPNYVFFKNGEKFETSDNIGLAEPSRLIGSDSFYMVFGSIGHDSWPTFRTTMYHTKNPRANEYHLLVPYKPNFNMYLNLQRKYIIGRNKLMLHSDPSSDYSTMHRCKRKARLIRVY